MSLEQALIENTAAVKALTEAMKAGGGSAKASGKTDAPKAEGGKHTKEEMQAMVTKHKDKLGVPATRELVKSNTGKDKMGEVDDPAAIDKLYNAAKAALEAAEKDDGV